MTEEISEIDNYIFKEDIGQGNFGKVKLAIYKPTNEEFAVKIINKKMIKIKMKNVIFKENEIITKFNHINVIYVYEIIDTPENYYIIMEYCKRGELFDYIVNHKRIKEEEASIFFYQLINGVEHIHSKGIAHRDLKPENILLTQDKIIKIIDFGLSHEFNGEDFLKTKCGSPSYASPEIISHPFYDGFKTDIWCCGIILYAMLCGYLPFDGDDNENNNNTLFKNIMECNLEFPDYVSELGKDLICKILNVKPDERISITDIKKHPFYIKGKNLCLLDYSLIEETIIKKRSYKKNYKKNLNINIKNISNDNNKNVGIEISENYKNNKEEENKKYNYFNDMNIKENNLINLNSNSINIDFNSLNKKRVNNINFLKLNKEQIKPNNNNNQILNTDVNKYNQNILSMLKISKNNILFDKLLNAKLNYTKTLEQDKLYTNNHLSTLNKEKKIYNYKPSFRDILKNDKKTLYFNFFGNSNNTKNIFLNKLDKHEFWLDKKIQNNDTKTFNDEIFLRNFRKNLLKREKLNKTKNTNIDNQRKNNTINIDNKSSRIISLSNDNKIIKKNLVINEHNIKLNNIKKIIQNYEDKNSSNSENKNNKKINHINDSIGTKIKIISKQRNDNRFENISSDKYLNNKSNIINKINEYNIDNLNIKTFIKENSKSFINNQNKNLNSINKENYLIPINKEHIYKSENNYKRKELSLQKTYKNNDDKINLSKLIQNKNKENDYKKAIKIKNKSSFNKPNLHHKTIESYNISNRNNTIENNRMPLNLTKKMRNFNFENKLNEIRNLNDDLIGNKFIKNSRNLIRIKNNDGIKTIKNEILPKLSENNRIINNSIKNII